MPNQHLRIGIVGASSLLGRELSEEIGRSSLAVADLVLFDAPDAEGRLTTAADELTFIQKIEAESLTSLDFVFFAGSASQTLEYWQRAREDGATIIDLTRALTTIPGAVSWSPVLGSAPSHLSLESTVIVPAHGASLMLALVAERLRAAGLEVRHLAATVLLPVSEFGRPGMDELHQQTVSLLSFQPVPQEIFGAQVAFNLLTSLGAATTPSLAEEHRRITEQFSKLLPTPQPELSLQLVQAPVFHGYTISLLVELSAPAELAAIERALEGSRIQLLRDPALANQNSSTEPAEDSPASPSNLAAAGQDSILARVTPGSTSTRLWLWLAADNLRLAATSAVEAALELRHLRPQGAVQ